MLLIDKVTINHFTLSVKGMRKNVGLKSFLLHGPSCPYASLICRYIHSNKKKRRKIDLLYRISVDLGICWDKEAGPRWIPSRPALSYKHPILI